MRRIPINPRQDWQARVEEGGLIYHTFEGKPYWFEGAYYTLTAAEVDVLESATAQLHRMCLEAVDHVIRRDLFGRMHIAPNVAEAIRREWDREPPTLYGRFDLGFDGSGSPKLFEYNADTPTALLEAAVTQWQWLQDRFPGADQFNSIWEGLIEQWRWIVAQGKLPGGKVHFAAQDHWEDVMTVAVLRDTAEQAGLETDGLAVEEIGWNSGTRDFRDLDDRPMQAIFKLYPWEFMAREEFGHFAVITAGKTDWIEPIWKMVLSNKAILAILWEMYPDHPLLLPAYLDSPRGMRDYVCKPILSREGANIEVVHNQGRLQTEGPYGDEPKVWQGLYALPDFDGNHPVIGSWIVGEDPRGIGIRETEGLVTDDLARFVPHRIG